MITNVALRLFTSEVGAAREVCREFDLQRIDQSPDEVMVTGRSDELRTLGDDRFLAGL